MFDSAGVSEEGPALENCGGLKMLMWFCRHSTHMRSPSCLPLLASLRVDTVCWIEMRSMNVYFYEVQTKPTLIVNAALDHEGNLRSALNSSRSELVRRVKDATAKALETVMKGRRTDKDTSPFRLLRYAVMSACEDISDGNQRSIDEVLFFYISYETLWWGSVCLLASSPNSTSTWV